MILASRNLMSATELEQMCETELENQGQVALGHGHLRVANEEPSDVDPKGPGGDAAWSNGPSIPRKAIA